MTDTALTPENISRLADALGGKQFAVDAILKARRIDALRPTPDDIAGRVERLEWEDGMQLRINDKLLATDARHDAELAALRTLAASQGSWINHLIGRTNDISGEVNAMMQANDQPARDDAAQGIEDASWNELGNMIREEGWQNRTEDWEALAQDVIAKAIELGLVTARDDEDVRRLVKAASKVEQRLRLANGGLLAGNVQWTELIDALRSQLTPTADAEGEGQ